LTTLGTNIRLTSARTARRIRLADRHDSGANDRVATSRRLSSSALPSGALSSNGRTTDGARIPLTARVAATIGSSPTRRRRSSSLRIRASTARSAARPPTARVSVTRRLTSHGTVRVIVLRSPTGGECENYQTQSPPAPTRTIPHRAKD
jgi:hypothetical protein